VILRVAEKQATFTEVLRFARTVRHGGMKTLVSA